MLNKMKLLITKLSNLINENKTKKYKSPELVKNMNKKEYVTTEKFCNSLSFIAELSFNFLSNGVEKDLIELMLFSYFDNFNLSNKNKLYLKRKLNEIISLSYDLFIKLNQSNNFIKTFKINQFKQKVYKDAVIDIKNNLVILT